VTRSPTRVQPDLRVSQEIHTPADKLNLSDKLSIAEEGAETTETYGQKPFGLGYLLLQLEGVVKVDFTFVERFPSDHAVEIGVAQSHLPKARDVGGISNTARSDNPA